MSRRKLDITEHQAKTYLRAAEATGAVVEVKTATGVVRFIPAVLAKNDNEPTEPVAPPLKGHL